VFHGVKKQPLRSFESDLLMVFANNVMPANVAAWNMAKRKFYINEPFDQQMLPFLLEKFPEKFRILRNQVRLESQKSDANCPGYQLSSQDSDTISLGDIVSYCVGLSCPVTSQIVFCTNPI
jgi:hypothetical protein